MGYTHYWNHRTLTAEEVAGIAEAGIAEDARKLSPFGAV